MTGAPQDHAHDALPELLPTADGHRSCAECNRVIYSAPKLAAAAVIAHGGGIVLVKRGIESARGKWTFPSGYVNRGEVVERAAERETLEETGLQISAKWLVGVYSEPASPIVLAAYHAEVDGGELVAADDAIDARVFGMAELPPLAFEHDNQVVRDWVAAQKSRGIQPPERE